MASLVENRMAWLDALRLTAGVSVICMHASFDWNGQPFSHASVSERIIPVTLNTIFYLARTELFLIISLFLLVMSLDRRPRSYRHTLGEQWQRLMIPYFAWMMIYVVFNMFKAWQLGYLQYLWHDMTTVADTWIRWFVLGSIRPQMHFLPTLFALVLFFPLYQHAVKNPLFGLVIVPCLYLKREFNIWIYENIDEFYVDYWLRISRILSYTGYGFVGAAFYGILNSDISIRQKLYWVSAF